MFTTLVAAVKAASLVETLQGAEPSRFLLRTMKPSQNLLEIPWKTCPSRKTSNGIIHVSDCVLLPK